MNQRFLSLDVFRGITVASMILVNNPGSWAHIYPPFEHAPWHGCTPTDLVFPFFLFAVGNAMSFVMTRLEAAGTTVFLKNVLKRAILIFGVGVLLNWSPFVKWQDGHLILKNWESIRIFGVLQRIALCYLFASLIIYFFKVRGAFVIGATLLLGYWALCIALGNEPDPFSLEGFWGTHLDRYLLGSSHIYKGEGVPFDPEGLASTMTAIVNVIFGYLAGQYIQQKGKNYEMATNLFVAGCILVFAGLCWNMAFPFNKKIWSSSYVLYTSGLAINILAILIYTIELRQYKPTISRFFDVFGKNPLFIFVLSGLLPRLLALIRIRDHVDAQGNTVFLAPFGWFYEHVCKRLSVNPNNGSLVYACFMVCLYWSVAYWLDKRKIYIRV